MVALTKLRRGSTAALAGVCALVLAAPLAATAATKGYKQVNLVSDQAGVAAHQDPNLVNPWGVAFVPGNPFWVANNHSSTSTLYDAEGNPQALVVTIPGPGGTGQGAPTGQV